MKQKITELRVRLTPNLKVSGFYAQLDKKIAETTTDEEEFMKQILEQGL